MAPFLLFLHAIHTESAQRRFSGGDGRGTGLNVTPLFLPGAIKPPPGQTRAAPSTARARMTTKDKMEGLRLCLGSL